MCDPPQYIFAIYLQVTHKDRKNQSTFHWPLTIKFLLTIQDKSMQNEDRNEDKESIHLQEFFWKNITFSNKKKLLPKPNSYLTLFL